MIGFDLSREEKQKASATESSLGVEVVFAFQSKTTIPPEIPMQSE